MARKTSVEYWRELRRIARARGGKLLSRSYVDDTTKLRFRCAEGHEWMQSPSDVKQGRWCRACAIARRAEVRKAPAIARLRAVIARRGGAIVSKEYVNSQTKLRFRCAEGHVWEAIPNRMVQGKWCPVCGHRNRKSDAMRKQAVLRRLQGIARERGGAMLSPTFVHSKTPHRFRCARGHTWEAKAESIDAGVWCPTCKEEGLLARLRAKAEARGGALLSEKYRGGRSRLSWRCALGHRWEATAAQIIGGTWCPTCGGLPRGNIERMRQAARERGGQCLSDAYVDAHTRLRWRCGMGHEWTAPPETIIRGSWCRVCERGFGVSRRRLDIQTMRWMAEDRGGKCLSKTYTRLLDPLRWRCARGHEWTTMAHSVRRGCWCPVCARSVRGTLEGMRALARERGGRVLTRTWNDRRQLLSFVCARGHRFREHASVVKSGVWCPECAG